MKSYHPTGFLILIILFCYTLADAADNQALKTKVITLPFTDITAASPWVKAPDGKAEFILSIPDSSNTALKAGILSYGLPAFGSSLFEGYFPPPFATTMPGSDTLLMATPNGLLSIDRKGGVRIEPSLYGRKVCLVGTAAGSFWVQDLEGGMVALDPKTLAIRRETGKVEGIVIAVDDTGFWSVDYHDAFSVDGSLVTWGTRLIEYGLDGAEKRHFACGENNFPAGRIEWSAVDARAVWLVIQSPLPDAAYIPNGEDYIKLYRLDRATGQVSEVKTAPPGVNGYASLPGILLWKNYGENILGILNKDNMTTKTIGRLPEDCRKAICLLTETTLWCYARQEAETEFGNDQYITKTYRLNDLKEIPVENAGAPPSMLPLQLPQDNEVLGGDNERVWVEMPDQLLEITDNGEMYSRDYSKYCPSSYFAFYSPVFFGKLCLNMVADTYTDGAASLLIIQSGQQSARISQKEVMLLGSNEKRAWGSTQKEILTFTPDLKTRLIPIDEITDFGFLVVLNDSLYISVGDDELMVIDGLTGKTKTITSSNGRLPDNYRLPRAWFNAYAAPDGSLVLHLKEFMREVGTEKLMRYEPATDQWTLLPGTEWYSPLKSIFGIYGLGDDGTLYIGLAEGWKAMAKVPLSVARSASLAARTTRYLYLNTDLGICRIPWVEIEKID